MHRPEPSVQGEIIVTRRNGIPFHDLAELATVNTKALPVLIIRRLPEYLP
jgi:hypothetical protein